MWKINTCAHLVLFTVMVQRQNEPNIHQYLHSGCLLIFLSSFISFSSIRFLLLFSSFFPPFHFDGRCIFYYCDFFFSSILFDSFGKCRWYFVTFSLVRLLVAIFHSGRRVPIFFKHIGISCIPTVNDFLSFSVLFHFQYQLVVCVRAWYAIYSFLIWFTDCATIKVVIAK